MVVRRMLTLTHLSDRELLTRLPEARAAERTAVVHMIAYLAEVDRRRLYLTEACSSLFSFCIERLGYWSVLARSPPYRRERDGLARGSARPNEARNRRRHCQEVPASRGTPNRDASPDGKRYIACHSREWFVLAERTPPHRCSRARVSPTPVGGDLSGRVHGERRALFSARSPTRTGDAATNAASSPSSTGSRSREAALRAATTCVYSAAPTMQPELARNSARHTSRESNSKRRPIVRPVRPGARIRAAERQGRAGDVARDGHGA